MSKPAKSKYDHAIADAICEQLATTDKGLREILADLKKTRKDVPSLRTVHNWRIKFPEFLDAYEEARKSQATLCVDEARRIARTPLIGQIVTVDPKGKTVKTVDNVERSKLMVLTLLKSAALFYPAKFGEKVDLAVAGEIAVKRVVTDI